jgi:hypothetical protein
MKKFLAAIGFLAMSYAATAQVNAVEFGKNRVQYKKFKWRFYQTPNFNTYFSQNGLNIAKFVAQVAEKELPTIEQFVEYGLQRRANIIVYNHFDDLKQSNIGLDKEWQDLTGTTKLVNNKVVIFFNGDHADLRRQIREGIAKILLQNVLFGDDLGEFATNQALLDLPEWLTQGYVSYIGQNWSTKLDDDLKSAIGTGDYKNFYQFAFRKPELAGHAFWYFMEEKYKKENVTYFLYLARVYKSLNTASIRIAKKKYKELLKEFMQYNYDKYNKDIRQRRNVPRGRLTVSEEVSKTRDYFKFQANPNPRSNDYAVVEYRNGKYCVKLSQNWITEKILLKYGVRSKIAEINPNYPHLAWDGKGTRLAVVYWKEGKIRLFVYDAARGFKYVNQEMPMFEQVQDVKYMLDNNTLLLSAVKNGQTDIYIYKIDKQTVEQITNDVYDDIDPAFVAFPNKSGILYSSNRPSADAISNDTILPSNNRYNIFLIDNFNKTEFRQVSQMSKMKAGNARYPMQYNTSHFTFVSDENGIGNRYAGFFTTERAGLDTLVFVGDEVLRNPAPRDLDSTLQAWSKNEPDSVGYMSITNDSSYVFPLTNYASSLLETRIAGDGGQVTEVRREGDFKYLYKLKVDENTLKRRNINARPTAYARRMIELEKASKAEADRYIRPAIDSVKKDEDVFQNDFNDAKDSVTLGRIFDADVSSNEEPVLKKARLFDYTLKFSLDNVTTGFDNALILNRYQPYTGSGPVTVGTGYGLNGLMKASVVDLMEDLRFLGGARLPTFFNNRPGDAGSGFLLNNGGEYFFMVNWLKWRLDLRGWYYRSVQPTTLFNNPNAFIGNQFTNLYQVDLKYPLDVVRSVRVSMSFRRDKSVVIPENQTSLKDPDTKLSYVIGTLAYVHDNTLNPTTNIWNGLRYKVFVDIYNQLGSNTSKAGLSTINAGFDLRYYYPIYRNFIWAGRAAGDISMGDQKIVYYLGGTDGWLLPRFNSSKLPPQPPTPEYTYQALAQNLRGFDQNVTFGNNALVLNSEFRFPVFTTLLNRPINNAFLRNFQLVQFFDLGTAWDGKYTKIKRPSVVYSEPGNPLGVEIRSGGLGPFAGGYGFGARSTLLGYFLRFDAAWEMKGFFRGKPQLYLSMGLDF